MEIRGGSERGLKPYKNIAESPRIWDRAMLALVRAAQSPDEHLYAYRRLVR